MVSNFWLDRLAIARVLKAGQHVDSPQEGKRTYRLGPLSSNNGKYLVVQELGDNTTEWIFDDPKDAAAQYLKC